MANNQIRFDVGFNVNKSDLNTLTSALKEIQNEMNRASVTGNLTDELKKAGTAAQQLETVLNQSWNSKLGQLDLSKVNNSIKTTYGSVNNLKNALESSGAVGSAAYNKLASTILHANTQIKQSNTALDKLFQSFKNVFTYNISSMVFNRLTGTIEEAFNYTQKLDTSLNDIRIVTDKSADSMERFARQANEAAKNLGSNTLDYTKASLIYYQQGLSDEEVAARAETTIKAANVTGQRGEEVSEQLTAVWNGYKVTAEETEVYVDKLAAVAATTAADLEELSVGMSKVASAANAMGVDFDDLNAQIATIVSVTRQAPESVGTALKTIYARMGDLSVAGGVDEFGVSLGKVSEQMQMMGIQILDQEGNLRDMSDVIAEVASKWDGWTEAQKQAAAVAMAGKRQYNNLIALFDNWDMYTDALNTSIEAVGTLQNQQDIYMESTAAHLQTLKTEAQETYDILFDQNVINGFTDALTGALNIFNKFLDGVGGGGSAIIALGSIFMNIFNQQIGGAISNQLNKIEKIKQDISQYKQEEELIKAGSAKEGLGAARIAAYDADLVRIKELREARKGLTDEEAQELRLLNDIIAEEEMRAAIIEDFGNESRESYALREAQIEVETTYLEQEKKTLQQIIDIQKTLNQEETESLMFIAEENDLLRQINLLATEKSSFEEKEVFTEDEKLQLKLLYSKVSQEEAITEEEISFLIQMQVKEIKAYEEYKAKLVQEAQLQKEYEEGTYNAIRAQNEQRKKDFSTGVNKGKNVIDVKQIVSGITAITMLITSIRGVFKTLNDESLSAKDKMTQAFSALLAMLPMVVFNLTAIKTTALATWTAITGPFAPVIALIGVITTSLVAAGIAAYKAYHQIENEAKESAKRVKELKNRYDELKSSVEDFKQTASNYDEAINALDDLEQGTEEYAEALKKANEQAKDLIEMYELWNSFTKENGLIKIDENALKDIQNQKEIAQNEVERNYLGAQIYANNKALRNEANNLSRDTIGPIGQTYDLTTKRTSNNYFTPEEIDEAALIFKKLNDNLIEITEERLKEEEFSTDNLRKHINILAKSESIEALLNYIKSIEKATEANEYYAKQIINSKIGEDQKDWAENIATTEEGIDAALEQQLLDVLSGSSNIEKFNNDIENLKITNEDIKNYGNDKLKKKDLYKRYATDVLQYGEDEVKVTNKGIFDKEGKQLETTKNVSDQQMREALTRIDKQNELLNDWLEKEEQNIETKKPIIETLQKNQNEIEEKFGADFVNSIFNTLANGENKLNFADLFKELRPEDVEKLKGMSSEELIKNFGISEEQWADLAGEGAESFQVSWEKAFEGYDISYWLEGQSEKITGYLDNANTALSAMNKEGKLTNKELAAMTESLQALEQEYPSLAAIQDKTSTAYYNKLLAVREALEDENKLIAQQKENLAIDETIKIDVESDGGEEELEEKLLDICREDYEVLVSVKTDIQSDFDAAASSMNSIEEMSSKIGDDFKIAAKDMEELNDVFPGILANMQLLKDGTVQLDKDIVNSAMDAAKQEMAINTAKTIDELDKQQKELEGKRDAAKVIATIAGQIVNTETTAAEQKENIDNALNQLKVDNSETTAENQSKDQQDVATNAATAAQSMANSYGKAYQIMAEDAIKWSKVAHEALIYGSDKDAKPPSDPGDFASGSIQIRGDIELVQSDKGDLNNFEDYTDVGDWKEVQEYYDNLTKVYDEAINSVIGKKGELLGREHEINQELKNISKGLGADGKKSGKSGGSKGKDKKDKDEKQWKDEFDRYWELNKAIEATDRAIQKLEKDQENLHGQELINSLQKENELLETQKSNYEALLAAQQERAAALRGELGTMGVIFDASGAIINYAEATAQALAAYNAAIQQYNAGLIDETTLGVAEKAFENFKKLLEEYDKLYYTEIQETQDKLEELARKQRENNLKAWEEGIKVKLDWSELKRGWKDFKKMMKEDFKSVFKDLTVESKTALSKAKTYTKKDGTIKTDIQAIKDVEAEIDKMKAGGKSEMFESISQAQEKLKELNSQLQNDATELHDLWKQAWDDYLDGIDQVEEELEQVKKLYEDISAEIEFEGKLIELLYGDTKQGLELMDSYYEASIQNVSNMIDSAVDSRDTWEQLFKSSGADENDPKSWTKDQQKYYENWKSAQQDVYNLTLQQIELMQNQYKNTIDEIYYDQEKRLEETKEEWEKVQKESEMYYDRAERAYQIQTLENKMDKEINATTNLKAQQKLQDLRDKELKTLREKTKLREIDVKNAELEYELALKEIALEDAQNNKTSMKLTRNEQGNWTYQYVADEDDITEKRQSLLDTYNELYQLWDEKMKNVAEELIELEETYLTKSKEIEILALTNKEEAEKKRKALDEWYLGERERLYNENEEARQKVTELTAGIILKTYEQDETSYETMTDHEKDLVDSLKEKNISDYQEIKDAVETDLDGIGDKAEEVTSQSRNDWHTMAQEIIKEWNGDGSSVARQVNDAYKKCQEANDKYQEGLRQLQRQTGISFGPEGIEGALDKTKEKTDAVREATKDYAEQGRDYIMQLKEYVQELEEQWNKVKDAINEAIKSVEEYLKVQAEAAEAAAKSAAATQAASNASTATTTADTSGTDNGKKKTGGTNTEEEKKTMSSKHGVRNDKTGQVWYFDTLEAAQRKASILQLREKDKTVRYSVFASGGYTGEWGEDGRLAVLHQKELVLNKDDTKNFLSGIQMIRDMANLNGSIEKSILRSIANMAIKTSGINPGSIQTNNRTSQSNNTFNITAEFPNANSVDEIRQAILTLPNIASQYINSNLK